MTRSLMLVMLSMCTTLGEGRGFRQRSAADIRMDVKAVHQELQEALRGALGNGHGIDHMRIATANATLLPMFQSLPKNEHGRVGSAAMRYAVQRYFSKSHGWVIKGFESHSSEQDAGKDAGILGSKVPGYVEATLEGMLQKGGFLLPDILTVVIVVERLIFDEVARSVESAYHLNHLTTERLLSYESLLMVIESHLIVEMMERHEFDREVHEEDRKEIHELYPNWDGLQEFVRDVVAMETSSVLRSGTQNPFTRVGADTFSFDDAVRIAQRISNDYGLWGNQECMELRGFMADMDRSETGRVSLVDFYGASAINDRWGFAESPEYLRELGALDESSKALGPQILISNYAYGMSNCLTSTPYYSVCCLNECEGILQQIEIQVAKPSATPREILDGMMHINTVSFDTAQVSSKLHTKLDEIAAKGNGKVNLHGRLFAQWLHYAFPRECPFPHAAGSVQPKTQGERLSDGESIFMEPHNISKHIQQQVQQQGNLDNEAFAADLLEDGLWSWDEELLHTPEPKVQSKSTFESLLFVARSHHSSRTEGLGLWAAIIAASILFAVKYLNKAVTEATTRRMLLPTTMKSHDL